MMYPTLCRVSTKDARVFSTKEIWIQLGFSIVINQMAISFLQIRGQLPQLRLSWALPGMNTASAKVSYSWA